MLKIFKTFASCYYRLTQSVPVAHTVAVAFIALELVASSIETKN